MMKVIGIDPGLSATGIGIVKGTGLQVRSYSYGTIHTASRMPLPQRLDHIYSKLFAILKAEAPDVMVIEKVFSLARHPKSGISLGNVTGVILLAGQHVGLRAEEISVRETKEILTGNGNATKAQLEMAVRRRLNIAEPIRPWHASDAIGLSLIGLYRCH